MSTFSSSANHAQMTFMYEDICNGQGCSLQFYCQVAFDEKFKIFRLFCHILGDEFDREDMNLDSMAKRWVVVPQLLVSGELSHLM